MAGSESRGRGGRWRWRGREDEFSTSGPGLSDEQQQQLSRVADELLKRYTITPKIPGREPEPREPESAYAEAETAYGEPETVGYTLERPTRERMPVMPEGSATDVVDEVAQALSASYHVEAIRPPEPEPEVEVIEAEPEVEELEAEVQVEEIEPDAALPEPEPESEVEPEPAAEARSEAEWEAQWEAVGGTTEAAEEPAPRGKRPSLIDRWLHPDHRGELGEAPEEEAPEEEEARAQEEPGPDAEEAAVYEPVPEPVAEAEPVPELVSEPEPEPEPVAEAEPVAEPELVVEPEVEPEPELVAEAEPEPVPVPLTKEELSAALIEVFEFDSDWFIKEDLPSAPELEFESSAVSTGSPVAEDEQPLVWSERELDDESMGDLEFTRTLLSEPVQMNAPEAPTREAEPEVEPEPVVAEVVEALTPPEPAPGEEEESAEQRQMVIHETESEMAQREVAELEAALEVALQAEQEAAERSAAARDRLDDARAALALLQDLEAQGVPRPE